MALLLAALGGCGGSGGVPRSVAALLRPQVSAIRGAASAGDATGARAAAVELRRIVAAQQATGDLGAKQAATILAAANQVEAQLAMLAPPATATPTSTSTATVGSTTTSGGHQEKGKGKERGGGSKD